jgi:hypothetical protein
MKTLCGADRMLCTLLGAAAIMLILAVGAARASTTMPQENFKDLYTRNLRGLVDGVSPMGAAANSAQHGSKGQAGEGRCWPGFAPEKNENMSTCCWYGAQTCCKSSVAGYVLRAVTNQLEAVHKNGTNDKCYAAIADLLCLWCSPETAKFTEGDQYMTVAVCPSLCTKLWDSCHDQQDTFGIHPKALTARQLCTALLVEEEDKETSQGGVQVVIASASSTACYGGASLSVIENSNCLPHITSAGSSSDGPSGGSIAAMVLVPFLVIGITVVAVVVYFRARKRREGLVYLGAGGGGGGADEFSLSADAFGEEGGFLDEEGDVSEGTGSSGLLSDEDSK